MLQIIVQYQFYRYCLTHSTAFCAKTTSSGFRSKHCTETALIKIIDDLLFKLNDDCFSGMVLVDSRKAFDMIDHTQLLKKLEVYGLSKESLQWFTSYLKDRCQLVKMGDKLSNLAVVRHGFPQGFPRDPCLVPCYLLFLSMTYRSTTLHQGLICMLTIQR